MTALRDKVSIFSPVYGCYESLRTPPKVRRRLFLTDNKVSTTSYIQNVHNLHVWATEDPPITRHSSFQHIFSAEVSAGIVDGYVTETNGVGWVGGSRAVGRLSSRNAFTFIAERACARAPEHAVSMRRCPSPISTSRALFASQLLSRRLASTFSRSHLSSFYLSRRIKESLWHGCSGTRRFN